MKKISNKEIKKLRGVYPKVEFDFEVKVLLPEEIDKRRIKCYEPILKKLGLW